MHSSARPTVAPLTLNVPDFRKLSGIGKSSIYKLIEEGHLESVMVCGRRLIIVASYERYIETQKQRGFSKRPSPAPVAVEPIQPSLQKPAPLSAARVSPIE